MRDLEKQVKEATGLTSKLFPASGLFGDSNLVDLYDPVTDTAIECKGAYSTGTVYERAYQDALSLAHLIRRGSVARGILVLDGTSFAQPLRQFGLLTRKAPDSNLLETVGWTCDEDSFESLVLPHWRTAIENASKDLHLGDLRVMSKRQVIAEFSH